MSITNNEKIRSFNKLVEQRITASEETIVREFSPLESIDGNYPK